MFVEITEIEERVRRLLWQTAPKLDKRTLEVLRKNERTCNAAGWLLYAINNPPKFENSANRKDYEVDVRFDLGETRWLDRILSSKQSLPFELAERVYKNAATVVEEITVEPGLLVRFLCSYPKLKHQLTIDWLQSEHIFSKDAELRAECCKYFPDGGYFAFPHLTAALRSKNLQEIEWATETIETIYISGPYPLEVFASAVCELMQNPITSDEFVCSATLTKYIDSGVVRRVLATNCIELTPTAETRIQNALDNRLVNIAE